MATKYKGYMGNMLKIDLSTGKTGEFDVTDRDREMYLGGKGMAAKLLHDLNPKGVDPLSPDAVLVINTGPLTGSMAPCTSRFNISAKSPLTGGIGNANSGGNFGHQLKRCGYDALVVTGKADNPVYIDITDENVEIKDASDMWGKDTEQAQEMMDRKAGRLVIGPAGENLVKYSCILSGERVSGRCGLGAVMGSKNLKGLQAKGTMEIPIHDKEGFKRVQKQWREVLKSHPITGDSVPKYGTAEFLNKLSISHTLPTKNFSRGNYEHSEKISGEELTEKYLVKNTGCVSCPIRCGRIVEQDGKQIRGPEFETLGLFGSNLLIDSIPQVSEWNRQMDLLGIDTISCGGVIGFAMELTEKGLLESDLKFGKADNIGKTIEDIAYRRGLGDDLAEGVRALSEKYGGREFAIHVKGLEMAAYEPRGAVGMGLGYATANRGACHIDAGYLVFFERLAPVNLDPYKTGAKPAFTIFQQNMLDAVSAAGNCIFTTYAVVPKAAFNLAPYSTTAKIISKIMDASGPVMDKSMGLMRKTPMNVTAMIPHSEVIARLTGMNMTLGKFVAAGERVFNIERLYNLREGITGAQDTLPDRLAKQSQEGRPEARVPLEKLLPHYYKVRGWDSDGVPTRRLLKQLGMEEYTQH